MNFPAAHALPGSSSTALHDRSPHRPPLVVFAALRWQFDWQRPQQLLTRLAKHYRVFYVEEPVTTHQDAYLECTEAAEGVEVLVAHTRCDAGGFHADQLPVMQALLVRFLRERGTAEPLAWIDAPAALPLAEALRPRALVYDCHDDAAADDEAARALEALTRLASPLLLKMAGTSEGQLAKMRAAAKDRSSVVTECGDRYCLTVAHYVFQRADAAKGCVEGEVVGRETILGYATAAQRIVLGDGRRITVWMAPELGCFALKVTTEDRESRVLSGREAVRVDR